MRKETFYLDGINAADHCIVLQEPVTISGLRPVVETVSVPGRNGNLTFATGAFENRTGTARCYSLRKSAADALTDAGKFLLDGLGYRRLECSDDPGRYWMARVVNGPDIEQRARLLAPFDIEFDVMPQHWSKDGEQSITVPSGGKIWSTHSGVAKPKIKVYGSGAGNLYVNGITVKIKSLSKLPITIDSDTENAYNDEGSQNTSIDAPVFPTLRLGDNTVSFDGGITKIEITPRWWDK